MKYKNGIESRNKILNSAKTLFYNFGFKKTTMAMIAEHSDVPVGLVSYYFKKDELLCSIHENYFNDVLQAIEMQVGQYLDNSLQAHLLLLQIQNITIYDDERCISVYMHMVDNGLLSKEVVHVVDNYLLDCMTDFGINLTPEMFTKYIAAQYGAHRELVRVYNKDMNNADRKALFYITGTVAMRMAYVDRHVISANVEKSEELLGKMDLSGIHFLP